MHEHDWLAKQFEQHRPRLRARRRCRHQLGLGFHIGGRPDRVQLLVDAPNDDVRSDRSSVRAGRFGGACGSGLRGRGCGRIAAS